MCLWQDVLVSVNLLFSVSLSLFKDRLNNRHLYLNLYPCVIMLNHSVSPPSLSLTLSSWGDPVWLTGRSNPRTKWVFSLCISVCLSPPRSPPFLSVPFCGSWYVTRKEHLQNLVQRCTCIDWAFVQPWYNCPGWLGVNLPPLPQTSDKFCGKSVCSSCIYLQICFEVWIPAVKLFLCVCVCGSVYHCVWSSCSLLFCSLWTATSLHCLGLASSASQPTRITREWVPFVASLLLLLLLLLLPILLLFVPALLFFLPLFSVFVMIRELHSLGT